MLTVFCFALCWLLQFPASMDLRALVQTQTSHTGWGDYAQRLLDGGFRQPGDGGHDDKAHPPIHPITVNNDLQGPEKAVYELVTRHFLACCSDDGTLSSLLRFFFFSLLQITFAAMWSASTSYAYQIAPPGLGAMTQALVGGIHFGLGLGAGSLFGGLFYDAYVTIFYCCCFLSS